MAYDFEAEIMPDNAQLESGVAGGKDPYCDGLKKGIRVQGHLCNR